MLIFGLYLDTIAINLTLVFTKKESGLPHSTRYYQTVYNNASCEVMIH